MKHLSVPDLSEKEKEGVTILLKASLGMLAFVSIVPIDSKDAAGQRLTRNRHLINRLLVSAWRERALKAEAEVEQLATLMETQADSVASRDNDLNYLRLDLQAAQDRSAAISEKADQRVKDLRGKAESAIAQLSNEIEILSNELLQYKKNSEEIENEFRQKSTENAMLKNRMDELLIEKEKYAHREAAIQLRMEAMAHKAAELESLLQYNNRSDEFERQLQIANKEKWEATVGMEKLKSELEWRITNEHDSHMQLTNLQNDLESLRGASMQTNAGNCYLFRAMIIFEFN